MAINATMNVVKHLRLKYNVYQFINYSTKCRVFNHNTSLLMNEYYNNPFRICAKLYCDDTLHLGKDPLAKPKVKRKKTVEPEQIMLYNEFKSPMVTTVEQATKIAKAKNLRLMKVSEATPGHKAVYELTSIAHLVTENNEKKKGKKKDEKIKHLAISSKISDHDLGVKIKNINKALDKQYKVHVVISKEAGQTAIGTILKKIKDETKKYGTVKGKIMLTNPKFDIVPLEPETSEPEEDIDPEKPKEL